MSVAAEFPVGVPSDGMIKVAFVASLADASKVTLSELTAGTSVDATCYLSSFTPSADAQSIEDRRLCTKQVFEDYGSVTYTIGDITYVYDTQNPSGTDNKLYAALPTGTTGFLVVAWGKDADEAWAAGDVVDIYPVKMGPRVKQPPEQNSKLKVTQKPFVTARVIEDFALTA